MPRRRNVEIVNMKRYVARDINSTGRKYVFSHKPMYFDGVYIADEIADIAKGLLNNIPLECGQMAEVEVRLRVKRFDHTGKPVRLF